MSWRRNPSKRHCSANLFPLNLERMENYEERNADFLKSVRRWQEKGREITGRPFSVGTAVRKALTGGAPRFYLTREHVWKKMRERRQRLPPREKPYRRAMWSEIEAALDRRMREAPRESRWEALDYVLTRHSPSGFFISEPYAMRLVYRQIKGKDIAK